ncbi:hypothetical protein CCAX7_39530 [Capsulimonas corticalis]|uniref:Uncharacterized protein n=1 Tax=Capsulimonas corticalis TaxID=2219043 RepID=A0A402D3M1_9BACT|nr:aldehyde dehydrogenase family protein [Capsulimonas corticalis]BDI31902.1 hypothetical protein CCAX7_39530 [Capsulimonas corticalis]
MTLTSTRAGKGEAYSAASTLDGSVLHQTTMLSPDQLTELASAPAPIDSIYRSSDTLGAFLGRLADQLDRRREPLLHAMRHETGFISRDCEEVFEGVTALLRGFCANDEQRAGVPPGEYRNGGRAIQLSSAPWGAVAVILPQNAFLYLAATCLASALAAGNRVALRAPSQSALSAMLLEDAIREAGIAEEMATVVTAKSKEFVSAFQESEQPGLIHYMGSSRHAPAILADTFQAGKASLIDGDGNVIAYIGQSIAPEDAAALLTQGAVRYNGQTCTSVNGAIIHPARYDAVRGALLRRWRSLTWGDTIASPDVSVGPLLSQDQAHWCEQQIAQSGGTVLSGGKSHGNILEPTLLESPEPNSGLVREGLFGPALWIASGDAEQFTQMWRGNKYPLCAAVIGALEPTEWWLSRLPGAARLVIDGDPSIEDIFEPWGGYLGSGANPVSDWKSKYRRTLQIDIPVSRR